jgi:hypothetical protein
MSKEEKLEKLHSMEINDVIMIDTDINEHLRLRNYITRVPGGWIYTNEGGSAFVPFKKRR